MEAVSFGVAFNLVTRQPFRQQNHESFWCLCDHKLLSKTTQPRNELHETHTSCKIEPNEEIARRPTTSWFHNAHTPRCKTGQTSTYHETPNFHKTNTSRNMNHQEARFTTNTSCKCMALEQRMFDVSQTLVINICTWRSTWLHSANAMQLQSCSNPKEPTGL